jgi:hypothetical protein
MICKFCNNYTNYNLGVYNCEPCNTSYYTINDELSHFNIFCNINDKTYYYQELIEHIYPHNSPARIHIPNKQSLFFKYHLNFTPNNIKSKIQTILNFQ